MELLLQKNRKIHKKRAEVESTFRPVTGLSLGMHFYSSQNYSEHLL